MQQKMFKVLVSAITLLLMGCLPSDKNQQQKKNDRYDTFVQIALIDHPGIIKIREAVASKVDAIIKEELEVPDGVEFPSFHIPSWQRKASRLTVYYLNGLKKGEEQYVANSLNKMQQAKQGLFIDKELKIAGPIKFFGGKNEYLVFSVSDPSNSLGDLNEDIKTYARQAQTQYKQRFNNNLYNIEKSEQFAYNPHIAIGRIQPDYFSKFVPGLPKEKLFKNGTPEEQEKIAEKIRKRIELEVFPIIVKMLKEVPTKLNVNSFCLYGYSSDRKIWRECIKEYPLQRK